MDPSSDAKLSSIFSNVLDVTIDLTRKELVNKFNKTLVLLIECLIKTYAPIPDTETLRGSLQLHLLVVNALAEKKDPHLIKTFHDSMHEPLSQDSMTRDDFITSCSSTIAFLQPLGFAKHWPNTPESHKCSIWRKIKRLDAFSTDYHDSVHKHSEIKKYAASFLQTDEFQSMMTEMKSAAQGSRDATK